MSLRTLACLLAALAGCTSARPAPTSAPLRFGASPIADLQARRHEIEGIAQYLQRKLGRAVEIEIPDSYQATTQALAERRWDVALVGPILYTRAHETGYDAVAMPVRGGTMVFTGAIVARADRGPRSLSELKGKRLAFVDPNSSSGFQYQVALLLAQGLKGADYQKLFLGSHKAVARAVFDGQADAGGCYEDALEQALSPEERGQVAVLGRTDPVPGDVFAARRDAPEFAAVREALLVLSAEPDAAHILSPLRATALSAPDEKLFDSARRIDLLVSEEGGF